MYKGKRILCVIPARAGSRGLRNKNRLSFLKKPLIAWTIKAALASRYLDKVIVSTDDLKMAGIAKKYGAQVPFLRPKSLASSGAKVVDAVFHVLDTLSNDGESYDLVILLQPTSPLRITRDIDNAIRLLFTRGADSIVSVSLSNHQPVLSGVLGKKGCLRSFAKNGAQNKNRQEMGEYYRINGAIYLVGVPFLKKCGKFIGNSSYAYIMPPERSIDIDTRLDFDLAEFLMRKTPTAPRRCG